MKLFIARLSVALLLTTSLGTVTPVSAQAASLTDLQQLLAQLHKLLTPYALAQSEAVAQATIITVSTPQGLANAMAAATGGETIRLKAGKYGAISVSTSSVKVGATKAGAPKNLSPVTVTSDSAVNRAELSTLWVNAPKWRFENLSIRPTLGLTGVTVASSGKDVAIIRNDVATANSQHAATWTAENWLAKAAAKGISVNDGTRVEVAYNYIKFIRFGATVSGNDINFHHNKIVHVAGDGLRAFGPNNLLDNNYVANNYTIDTNHNDMFQSYIVPSGEVSGVTLRNNTLIERNPNVFPLATASQGIGLFDGYYRNWLIENNLVVVNHWHGITMYGGNNSTIRRNLVVDPIPTDSFGPSWITISALKNGSTSINSYATENYANTVPSTGNNVKVLGSEYGTYFVNPTNRAWTVKPGVLPFAVGAVIDSNLLSPAPFAKLVL